MTSIASAARRSVKNLRYGDGHSLFWALERGWSFVELQSFFSALLEGGLAADVLDLGAALLGCEALRSAACESRVWRLLGLRSPLRRDIQEIVAGCTGHARNEAAFIDKNTMNEELAGAQVTRHGGHAQHKLAMLVQHVEAVISKGPGAGAAILDAVVEFSQKKHNYWLKVAADDKGDLIDDVLAHAGASAHGVRLELGAYVGFSSLRLAGAAQIGQAQAEAWRSLSLEVDPLHVCVARHFLNLGERAGLGEVRTGQVKDALPRIVDELGERSLDLAFMDHRGTRFQEELFLIERQRMCCVRMDMVCDNVLHPGAPIFLWEEARPGAGRGAAIWSLREFGGGGLIEDWMAFERYQLGRAKLPGRGSLEC